RLCRRRRPLPDRMGHKNSGRLIPHCAPYLYRGPSKTGVDMNKREFLAVLKELLLVTASQSTVRALGISKTQLQRLRRGEQRVTRQLELLLHMYMKHGIPKQMPGEK